jgi:hypothetical protein
MCAMWHFLRYIFQGVRGFGSTFLHFFCSNSWGCEVPYHKQMIIGHISWMSLLTTYTTMCKLPDYRLNWNCHHAVSGNPRPAEPEWQLLARRSTRYHLSRKYALRHATTLRHRNKMTSPMRLPQCRMCSSTFPYNTQSRSYSMSDFVAIKSKTTTLQARMKTALVHSNLFRRLVELRYKSQVARNRTRRSWRPWPRCPFSNWNISLTSSFKIVFVTYFRRPLDRMCETYVNRRVWKMFVY